MRSLALILLATPALALAQGNNTIRSETKVVLVDAVVSDKKGYVHNLTAQDFEVFEDDKKQTITSFSSEADSAAGKAQAHYTILLFDESSTDISQQRRARAAAIQFIDANAGPNQMIAIVNFRGALQVAQNFTDDAGRLKTVLGGGQPSALSLNGSAASLASTAGLGAGNLFLAIRNLASNLASAPGRKTLVLLSADPELRSQERSAEIKAALDACNRANVAIYGIDTRGFAASPIGVEGRVGVPPVPGGGLARGTLNCNPGNPDECPQASPDQDFRNQQIALRVLSTGTGGFVISNTNDLAGGLEKIGQEQKEYYLIGYTPPDSPEGSCHKLRVKVDRHGTTVRARTGYCNARSNNALAGTSIERELESLPASPPGGVNAWIEAPFFYGSDNLARVNLAMEIPLKKIKTDKERGKLRGTVHMLGIAHRPDGSVAARFSESVALEFDDEKRIEAFLAAPLHYQNQFEIVPGSYSLEVAYDAGDDSRGKVKTPLVVDSYQPSQFALSGLLLSREYGPASDPRMHTDAAWRADRTPLVANGIRIIPSGSNRFQKSDSPAVYAEIYEPLLAGTDLSVTMRVVDRKTGQQKLDTGILPVALPSASGTSVIPIAKHFPIDSLPPGSYRLELDASDSAGKLAHRTADFEIE
jgi:VWFA-related protein